MTQKEKILVESIVQSLDEIKVRHVKEKLNNMEKSPDFAIRDALDVLNEICSDESDTVVSMRLGNRLKNARLLGCTSAISNCVDTDQRSYLPAGIVPVLQTLDFISDGLNVAIFGPSNAGKSYLAKALGVQACSVGKCEYLQCNALLEELAILGTNDPERLARRKRSLYRLPLLILDDFLLYPVVPADRETLATLIDRRTENKRSTIVCAQRTPEAWGAIVGDAAIADAIRTRVTRHYAVHIKYQEDCLR